MKVNEYLDSLNHLNLNPLLEEMHEYAKEKNVPIIKDEGLAFLRQIIKIKKPKRILEIGTAIGFSAMNMALASPKSEVVTIEKNENMYELAKENIKKGSLEGQIKIILADALDVTLEGPFDFIFIDAAKAQYIKFFEKFEPLLSKEGIILTDNLIFHGLVVESIENRNLRNLVNKIKQYNEYLLSRIDFDTTIYAIGDGIALSIKK